MAADPRLLVLDACVAINLRACGRWRQIFAAAECLPLMPEIALREVLYLFNDKGEREEAPLSQIEVAGELLSCGLDAYQLEVMLDLAARLGQGEAAAIAVARTRELPFATDDRAAQVAADLAADRLLTTPQLLRGWAESDSPQNNEIAEAIELIETRANFRPRPLDPDFDWWMSRRGSAEH